MKNFKNPFAINENKEIVYIKNRDTQNKEKYKNCYCPSCGEKLIPKMGEKNIWHFSHSSNKECDGNFETSLHIYAKEVIKNNNKILLPNLVLKQYLDMNKMDNEFIIDLHRWECENQERIIETDFIKNNEYTYDWIENERNIRDFKPDCIVQIGNKQLAIEILVTHKVDLKKEQKVKKANLDMIEINLRDIIHEIEKTSFDIDKYILLEASRGWIYKTRVESEENKLYNKIYNERIYVLNEKYTKKDLIEKRKNEIREKEYQEKLKRQKEQEKEKRKIYAIEHKEEYEKNRTNKIVKIIEKYSYKKQNTDIDVCNIPVRGEYAFNESREVWQRKIYDKFILNREGKYIQLAKVIYWIENYSGLKYFNEFNNYNREEIWS